MKLSVRSVVGVAALFFSTLGFSQTIQEGIASVDSHKFAKARQIYSDMIAKSPSDANNYFYIGNTYLTQFEPNFSKASEYFNKGVSMDGKNLLNKIGLATVKLGQGNKAAISEIQSYTEKSKDPEVLYRAAEALTMFENNSAPDAAIALLEKAIEKSQKGGVPAYYYYTLGDAYRLKKDAGKAMTAYDRASAVAKNKASVFTRMATLWMAAGQYKLAEDNLNKAIAVDPTYAPAYKAQSYYNWKFQQADKMTQDLINYTKYADEDPYTILEISKLYFTNNDFANAKTTLDKVFDKIDDPIKYKLRAYLYYEADANYKSASENLNKFLSGISDKSRIQPADQGLEGLILAGLAKSETNAAKKASMLAQANQKIAVAKAAKDETLNWDKELTKINGGAAVSSSSIAAGPTNPKIEALVKKLSTNPNDTNALVELGTAYQEAKNWNGALATWQKMASLVPNWEYAYYGQGVAYQQLANNEMAQQSYQKYIDTLLSKTAADQEANKVTLSYAYYLVAYYAQQSDVAKAKDYVSKALALNPGYQDAAALSKQLNK